VIGEAESIERERVRKSLTAWFTNQGLSDVKSPADTVSDMMPDVQADYFAKIVYGVAKLCEDFASQETKEQLLSYCGGLPSEYKLVLGVPKACESSVQRALTEWGFTHRIQLVALLRRGRDWRSERTLAMLLSAS